MGKMCKNDTNVSVRKGRNRNKRPFEEKTTIYCHRRLLNIYRKYNLEGLS